MRVIVFGATRMIGRGVVRECLLDPGVERVLAIGRSGSGQTHEKLRDLVLPDLTRYESVAAEVSGYDACFFCLGVSSAGMSEVDYRRITHDIAVAAARALAAASPGMTFVFVSGAGTNATSPIASSTRVLYTLMRPSFLSSKRSLRARRRSPRRSGAPC